MKLIREQPETVKSNLERRGDPEKTKWVDELLNLDKNWRGSKQEVEQLRHRRNVLSEKIAELKRGKEDVTGQLEETRRIPAQIKKIEDGMAAQEERIRFILMRLPNLLHDSVPKGKDDSENVEVKRWGEVKGLSFKPKGHIDLMIDLDLLDMDRAAKVSGARFYYMKNEAVLLELALERFAIDILREKGFTVIEPPFMIKREPYEGVTSLADFEDTLYKIENEDLYLIATSEHPMGAMFMNEVLNADALPLKCAGLSPCFRKEAGAHGKDTKGIFRVHQFNKIEQFIFCRPEDSWELHEELLANAENIYKMLEIPYRVVNICTGDIGTVAAKKYDIEAWMPAQKMFREVVSCSNCTDYQARRLNIRYREKTGEKSEFVHTLNSTAIATQRTIVAIIENYQQADGSIRIPKALVPYMGGLNEVRKKGRE
ncbi:MAG: serine--tRNA ligase [Promethearchaeati archaeon SRVP18_Atabeyarchaeia-1]